MPLTWTRSPAGTPEGGSELGETPGVVEGARTLMRNLPESRLAKARAGRDGLPGGWAVQATFPAAHPPTTGAAGLGREERG